MNAFEELGIEEGADAATIKAAYRRACSEHHPDRATDDADRAARTAKMKRINLAYSMAQGKTPRDYSVDEVQESVARTFMEFARAAEHDSEADLVGLVRKSTEERERNLHKEIARLKAPLRKYQRMLKRLKRKGKDADPIAAALGEEIGKLESQIADKEMDILFARDMREALKSYSYDVDAALDPVLPRAKAEA